MEIILGAAVSLLVQWAKKYGNNPWHTLIILLAVSLAAAGLYTALLNTGYWPLVGGILVTAGAFYTFIIQRFETTTGGTDAETGTMA